MEHTSHTHTDLLLSNFQHNNYVHTCSSIGKRYNYMGHVQLVFNVQVYSERWGIACRLRVVNRTHHTPDYKKVCTITLEYV